MHTTFPKPAKGSGWLKRKEDRRAVVAHEQHEMRAAKARDRHQCRIQPCEFASLKPPIDSCHMKRSSGGPGHRGQGGNPDGSRTSRRWIFSACRLHHGQYDAGLLDVQPQTANGAEGCLDFLRRTESGRMEVFAAETAIGVSVERNPS